nr:hypothetical protein [Gammaproteobacteria bacterium]
LSVISLDSMGESAQVNQPKCQTLLQLEHRWAEIRYQTPEKQRLQAFDNELNELSRHPSGCQQSAEYQLIQAMIKGSMAKLQSRLDGLNMIRQIEHHLQTAIKTNPAVMQGMSWTLLGLLYDKSPGWPFSIGDDKAAEQAYQKGLELNPDGVDANYYYGDFLRRKKQSEPARQYLLKASRGKQGHQSEIAFQGRMLDVSRALKKLDN